MPTSGRYLRAQCPTHVLAANPSTEDFNDNLISLQQIASTRLIEQNPAVWKPSTLIQRTFAIQPPSPDNPGARFSPTHF